MKNKTHMQEDGTRWTALKGECAAAVFQMWGATKIVPFPAEPSRSAHFQILLEDGWHYAHADRHSAYCAAQAIQAPTGEIAEETFRVRLSLDKVSSAALDLRTSIQELEERQSNLTRLIQEHHKSLAENRK
jgi:hypothetical protein